MNRFFDLIPTSKIFHLYILAHFRVKNSGDLSISGIPCYNNYMFESFSWLALVAIASTGYALSAFLDNYIADVQFKKRRPEATKLFGFFGYLAALAVLLFVAPPGPLSVPLVLALIAIGALDSLAYIPYLRALKYDETTGIAVLGQLNPVFALLFGWLLLGSAVHPSQIFSFALILGAAALIVFSANKRSLHLKGRAVLLMVIAIIGWVLSDVLFVKLALGHDFMSSFFWFLFGKALFDGLMWFNRSWRRRVARVWAEWKGRLILAVGSNQILLIGTETLWRFILTIAPSVALASVTENVAQLFITFGFGLAFSVIWPTFGREKLSRRSVIMHLTAVVLASIGIILL